MADPLVSPPTIAEHGFQEPLLTRDTPVGNYGKAERALIIFNIIGRSPTDGEGPTGIV